MRQSSVASTQRRQYSAAPNDVAVNKNEEEIERCDADADASPTSSSSSGIGVDASSLYLLFLPIVDIYYNA